MSGRTSLLLELRTGKEILELIDYQLDRVFTGTEKTP
jgi:hypothetical protein